MSQVYAPGRSIRTTAVPQWDLETDVAIVGFGAAGSCAAIEARNAAARVDIFEVAAAAGGSAALSGGEVYLGGHGGTRFPPASLVKGIFVNDRGLRFINEDCYHGRVAHYVLRQPHGRAWLLVDNDIFARPVLQEDVHIAAVGDSWEEVEQALGLVAGSLTATVAEFNRYASLGEDPYFHKAADWLHPLRQPPFAAISYSHGDVETHAFTLGGLATSPAAEVLDSEMRPLPGLYAAGRSACGLPRWGEGYSSGLSLGDSTFFGRQAGISAAAFTP